MPLDSTELNFLIVGACCLFVLGIALSFLSRSQSGGSDELVKQVEKELPGAQCAQCGFPGCHAYAEALVNGKAACDKCTPGGVDTASKLASLLGVTLSSHEQDDAIFLPRTVAVIHESTCTGCTKCAKHCPVDAISGAPRQAHQVDEQYCIGCNDCVKRCPVNCIELIRLEPTVANFNWDLNSIRFQRN